MDSLVAGTTPTIEYVFHVVDPADIEKAVLTLEYSGSILIQKTLASAVIGVDSISWTLTQEETLTLPITTRFKKEPAHMMINWLTTDGTRGSSNRLNVFIEPNDLNEVMT